MSDSSLCIHLRATVLLPACPDTDGLPGAAFLALSIRRNVTVAGATRRLLRNVLCIICVLIAPGWTGSCIIASSSHTVSALTYHQRELLPFSFSLGIRF